MGDGFGRHQRPVAAARLPGRAEHSDPARLSSLFCRPLARVRWSPHCPSSSSLRRCLLSEIHTARTTATLTPPSLRSSLAPSLAARSYFLLDQLVNAHGGFLRKTTTSIQYFRLLKKKRQLLLLEKLARFELLQSLSSEHINTLVEAARPVAWLDGDVIYGEGDEPDWLIFILEGHVDAVSGDGTLGERGPGEVLGLALTETGLTAVGKTVARGPVKGVAVTKADIDLLRAESPEFDQACRDEVKAIVEYVRDRVAGKHERSVQWLDDAAASLQTASEMPDATEFRRAKEEHSGAPLAIWLGIFLDGIPESFVIGAGLLMLLRGVSDLGSITFAQVIPYTLVAGLFLSNFPEALASSTTMRLQGWSKRRIFWLWTSLMVITAVGAGFGFFLVESLDPTWVVFAEGVAAGAMLTMIASAMIPEAVHLGNANAVGLSTLAGFPRRHFVQAARVASATRPHSTR